jgi:hypothetical protein
MTAQGPSRRPSFPVALLLLGLALRLPGLLFNGMADPYQIIFEWGAAVHRLGLVPAFGVNYGILSYAAYGVFEAMAEWMPRFWWLPYKVGLVGFDLGACLALAALADPRDRKWVVILAWLNPWFILHGAYHGFWEGPHLLFGLLAVMALRRIRDERWAWATAGALIMCSAMFKPQGLIHFAGPLGFYLGIQWLRTVRRPLAWYLAGLVGVAIVTSIAIYLAGGSSFAVIDNYLSVFTSMAKMSNGGPGLWRFVSWAYMEAAGQPGLVLDMRISRAALAAWNALAGLLAIAILYVFSTRLALARREPAVAGPGWLARLLPVPQVAWPDGRTAFIVLTLGTFVMSQFGPRAHISHSYVAMVLLVLFAVRDRVMLWLWAAMCVMLGLAHLSTFQFGGAVVFLPESQWFRYPQAGPLIDAIRQLPAFTTPDALLRFQAAVNGYLAALPGQQAISIMSLPVFLLAAAILWRLFRTLGERDALSWQQDGHVASSRAKGGGGR